MWVQRVCFQSAAQGRLLNMRALFWPGADRKVSLRITLLAQRFQNRDPDAVRARLDSLLADPTLKHSADCG